MNVKGIFTNAQKNIKNTKFQGVTKQTKEEFIQKLIDEFKNVSDDYEFDKCCEKFFNYEKQYELEEYFIKRTYSEDCYKQNFETLKYFNSLGTSIFPTVISIVKSKKNNSCDARFYVLIAKRNGIKESEILDNTKIQTMGMRTIPIEKIERAYKDVEKLAHVGYIEDAFIRMRNNFEPKTWEHYWFITPNTLELSTISTFRKLKPEENNPEFVAKYLKDWKEEMLKVNRMGIQKYRYEKYGKTF